MSEMKSLVAKRGRIKASVTQMTTFIQGFDIQNGDFSEIEVRDAKLEQLYSEFCDIQSSIDSLDSDPTDNSFIEFEDNYFSLKSKFKNLLKPSLSQNQLNTSEQSEKIFAKKHDTIVLPKISLPTFEGKIENWTSFFDLFSSTIDQNNDLADIQKFYYLKSSLKGEPLSLISSLPLTQPNYNVAIALLKERYSNKKLIVNAHLKALFSLPIASSLTGLKQLLDSTNVNIRALNSLGYKTEEWDILIVHMLASKLDQELRTKWELSSTSAEPPTFSEFETFLKQYIHALEASSVNKSKVSHNFKSSQNNVVYKPTGLSLNATEVDNVKSVSCPMCQNPHELFRCSEFLKLNTSDRVQKVKQLHRCFNCLSSNHVVSACKASKCKICFKPHNTLLHIQKTDRTSSSHIQSHKQSGSQPESTLPVDKQQSTSGLSAANPKVLSTGVRDVKRVLLSTAIVDVQDSQGNFQKCRALIDPGSEGSFISENCVQKLNLARQHCNVQVQGVGNTHVGNTHGLTHCLLRTKQEVIEIKAFILKRLTSVPSLSPPTINQWSHLTNIELADPFFFESSSIDIILGADVYSLLLIDGVIKGSPGTPSAINTKLGFLLIGEILTTESSVGSSGNIKTLFIRHHDNISTLMENFWNSEDIGLKVDSSSNTEEDTLCEDHFSNTHFKDDSGRFCVHLPFKPSITDLGASYPTALKRYQHLEHSFENDESKKESYKEFIKEYIELGHMKPTPKDSVLKESNQNYYLPHHAVYRPSSTSTKIRVVFDASSKTTNGTSLNDHLYTGPKLQTDVVSLLTRFRLHKFAFTADIEKFFRQILVAPSDQCYQRILWRSDSSEPVQSYDLCTVTYGTACAPYLSIRCLHQLADDIKDQYPEISKILKEDFYVDDLVSGANTIENAKQIKENLENVMKQSGFNLRKWSSNSRELINDSHTQVSLQSKDNIVNILGIKWDPNQDTYMFSLNVTNSPSLLTKRIILSEIAKLYDPLGLLCPAITKAKLILQDTWTQCKDWDEEVPQSIAHDFNQHREGLKHFKNITISRALISFEPNITYELVGFCDASEKAYAGVLYVRSVSPTHTTVKLLLAKSKIAPLKKSTIPRLELCGALLLAKMVSKVKPHLPIENTFLFTDSTVVLAWISKDPNKWKTFVSSRVSQIQSLTNTSQWSYVKSDENPADCASRGISGDKLVNNNKWWSGPQWLSDPYPLSNDNQHNYDLESSQIPESKTLKCALTTQEETDEWYLKFGSYTKAVRVTAYCMRYLKNLKQCKVSGYLTVNELEKSNMCIIKYIQKLSFPEDVRNLQCEGKVKRNSKLLSLNPFIDEDGVLRVGGRIQNSNLHLNKTHQIILPAKHPFITSLLTHTHEKYFHAGIQFIINDMRQKYWLVGNVRSLVRSIVRKCVKCIRFQGAPTSPIMGNLPASRVTLTKVFFEIGCDYGGPYLTKQIGGRCKTLRKTYLVIFICMSIKAVHIELVSDLSTETFLAALNRFISRRGQPKQIFSDNATNFVGADNSLKKFFKDNSNEIQEKTAAKGINWHFIPPSAPHMGGLWESAVKSAKHHLKRVLGDQILSFEELNTLVIQIEAILNSRPICRLSNDQSETDILTPGHFIIGESLTSLPDKETTSTSINYNKRWQLIQKLRRDFWKRWNVEYLHTLQQRTKWKTEQENIKVGDLVLIKEDNVPPMSYPMAIVNQIFPDKNMTVRTVELKTKNGLFRRPVVKIVKLPTHDP